MARTGTGEADWWLSTSWQPALPAIYRTIRSDYGPSISPGGLLDVSAYLYAPLRRGVTSGYQFLAAERRAWKFMRDAAHCFGPRCGGCRWKSKEAGED